MTGNAGVFIFSTASPSSYSVIVASDINNGGPNQQLKAKIVPQLLKILFCLLLKNNRVSGGLCN